VDDHRTLLGVDDTDLVAGMVRADEHREPIVELLDSERVVEGVKNDVVNNAVPMGAGGDDRLIHQPRIVAVGGGRKLTCGAAALAGRRAPGRVGIRPHECGTSAAPDNKPRLTVSLGLGGSSRSVAAFGCPRWLMTRIVASKPGT
jgi:hypothetical protein